MEVKEGYRQTEIGIIPEVWENTKVLDLVQRGYIEKPLDGNHGNIHPKKSDFVEYGIPFIMANNVQNGHVDIVNCSFISKKQADSLQKGFAQEGDVLITHKASIGNTAIINENPYPYIMLTPQVTYYRVSNSNRLCNRYLLYFFQSSSFIEKMKSVSGGGTRSYIGITSQLQLPVVFPESIIEQQAIATALTDVDSLITSLDKLIAKKRDIKQAIMQELLTGKTRLPGFDGDWEERELGQHLTFIKNGTNSRAELTQEGHIKYLHYGDIHGSSRQTMTPSELPSLPDEKAANLGRLCDGDLIFADASEDRDGIGKSVEMTECKNLEVVPGLHTIAVRFDKVILADGFKAYLQNIPSFINHLKRLASGMKVYSTNRSTISDLVMSLPSLDEQKAIATILSDMDKEIEALEERREKTLLLKQGMMQELLTGKTRLVKPATNDTQQSQPNTANIHFQRSVLAAEIVSRLHEEPTFGHVKFEKMIFLVEHLCDIDTGSNYQRKAAGPYDNRALRSIDSQLKKQNWFEARRVNGRYKYVPLEKANEHSKYFDRYFSDKRDSFATIIDTFRTADTKQCEIVATLYSAWNDLLQQQTEITDERIIHEVLNNWHESKKRIPEGRWQKALVWMRDKGFVPTL